VPARGGSKGLPGKNTRLLCGRPLIQWSIDTALACEDVDAVVVSTDDDQIAAVAAAAGAEVPFIRPPSLAVDTASSIDVTMHALNYLESNGRYFDIVLLLEPTSPLRAVVDIQAAIERIVVSKASAIVSVCRAETTHPSFMFRITERERLEPYMPIWPSGMRRQELEPLYYPDGTLYGSTVGSLKKKRSFIHEDTLVYEISKWKALEIDDIDDFELVEAIAIYKGLG
jgi:CMP-N,N'-diacetyllegionaminic acid synthase